MYIRWISFLLLPLLAVIAEDNMNPTVCITILVRNKEHSLPYFLGALEKQNYPKGKILLWIALDHSVDRSQKVMENWLSGVRDEYRQVNYAAIPDPSTYSSQTSDTHWLKERMDHVVSLKMAALSYAKQQGVDYIFFLDADAILLNRDTLKTLVEDNRAVVAPMLNSTGLYSNFWCGMDSRGYYKRTEEYRSVRWRHVQGVIKVPMVHSAVLIDLRRKNTKLLTFERNDVPDAPEDDIIIFAFSARNLGVDLYVDNSAFFGYIPVPRDQDQSLEEEASHWRELVSGKAASMKVEFLPEPFSFDFLETTKLGFDEIYLINLLRRPERFAKMQRILRIFNIGFRHFPAADGQQLNNSYLSELDVRMLEGYLDPYHKRPLKLGEIGCFLSHYFIWEEMVKKNYERVLILEDDAWFDPNFNRDLNLSLADSDRLVPGWDLLYIGRKILDSENEYYIEGTTRIVHPSYSYWTVGYILNLSGAKKFLAQKPLSKMVAVDEFIPIMFDKNTNKEWLSAFSPRDVVALSVNPLLIHPQLYTNEPGYYSDTEQSVIIDATVTAAPEFHALNSIQDARGETHGEL